VNLLKKIRLPQGWKFAPVIEKNGKLLRDQVRVLGREEHHPEGTYYGEWYQSGRRCRKAAGKFDEALEAARRNSVEVQALRMGMMPSEPDASISGSAGLTIATAIHE